MKFLTAFSSEYSCTSDEVFEKRKWRNCFNKSSKFNKKLCFCSTKRYFKMWM